MHKDWTKSVQATYQKQTKQLEKEIELQKAVKSITQSGEDEEEGSDFKTESGSKTKARINSCSLILKKLGKSDVKLVSSLTKAVAVSSIEEKMLKKEKKEVKNRNNTKHTEKTDLKKKDSEDFGLKSGGKNKEVSITLKTVHSTDPDPHIQSEST